MPHMRPPRLTEYEAVDVARLTVAAGVLDALLKHGNDDLTCADALLKMLPPLEAAMDSYRARATAAKEYPSRESSLARVVLIEAAVQGW